MTLYITTRGRVHSQITWASLSPRWREQTLLVAYPDEASSLRALGYPVLVYDGERNLRDKRQWTLDQHGDPQDPFILMDDDLRFAQRRTDDTTKFVQVQRDPGGEQLDDMMDHLLNMLDHAALVGITDRGGANRKKDPLYEVNGRVNAVIACDAAVAQANGIRFDTGPILMSDFHFGIQFLASGHRSLVSNAYTKDHRASNASGGCSAYRTAELQATAARTLQQRWPAFVRLRETKAWRGFEGQRLDVTVQWKKAYAAGCEFRSLVGEPLEPGLTWDLGTLEREEEA